MDTDPEVLMPLDWKQKGCPVCRGLWESGRQPPELAVSLELHARLHRCESCGTFWEQFERYADVTTESEARRLYPQAFAPRPRA
jgi:hypothetical protein